MNVRAAIEKRCKEYSFTIASLKYSRKSVPTTGGSTNLGWELLGKDKFGEEYCIVGYDIGEILDELDEFFGETA